MKSSISRRSRDEVTWEFRLLRHKKLVVSNGTQERVADGLSRGTTDTSMICVARSYRLLAIILCFYAYF